MAGKKVSGTRHTVCYTKSMIFLKRLKKIFPVLFFVLIFIIFIHPVGGDGDYYHHLNAGKYIVTNLKLPHFDEFTFTASGKEWINYSWLSGVIFYLLDITVGSLGISVFVSLVAVITLILLAVLLKSYKLPNTTLYLLVLLVAACIGTRWPSRPEIFVYPFVVIMLLIDRLRDKKPHLVFAFPLIIIFWANLYGSGVLAGVILLLLFIAKQLITDRFKINTSQRLFYISSLIAIPLSVLNGYGFKSLFYIYFIKDISKAEMEWFGIYKIISLAPYSYMLTFQYRLLNYILFGGFFIALLLINFKKIRRFVFEALLGLSIFIPIFAFRQAPISVILTAPFMAILLKYSVKTRYQKVVLITLGTVTAIAVFVSIWINPPNFAVPKQYPPGLSSFISQHDLGGNVLNNPQDGGFLSYYFYPKIHIFADTRDELYLGTPVFDDYFGAVKEKNLLPLLDKYRIDMVIGDLAEGRVFKELFYSPNWEIVYLGGHYFIAIPRSLADEKHIQALDFLDPFSQSQVKKDRTKDILNFYENLIRKNDATSDDKLSYSYALFFANNYNKAIGVASQLGNSLGPRNVLFEMSKDYLITVSYVAKRDCVGAKKYLNKIDQGFRGMMIFTPFKARPQLSNEAFRAYFQRCSF